MPPRPALTQDTAKLAKVDQSAPGPADAEDTKHKDKEALATEPPGLGSWIKRGGNCETRVKVQLPH
jgi:hypothetical protein